jgi:hypothetical protein
MNFLEAERAVRLHFKEEWNDITPVALPDINFTPPNETWVRFTMINSEGKQASIGSPSNNRFRRIGLVYIQVFAPENKGSVDARTKADIAADIFISNGLSGFHFYNVNAKNIGNDGNGYYQINVTAEYRYDRLT